MTTRVIRSGIGLLLLASSASTQAAQLTSQSATANEITKSYKTSEQTSDRSTGSSSGSDTLLERLIARRDDGLELEFDLPPNATPGDRARNWQLPARVLKGDGRRMQLLNTAQLEERLEAWLKAAKWNRSVCGRWIFTWNAFRIECDPQSIVRQLEEIDITAQDLRDGALYLDVRAIGPGRLALKQDGSRGRTFSAIAGVDPDKIRLERAEADVAIGEIMQKPIGLEAALRKRSSEQVAGSISVIWETDDSGTATKRTTTTALEIKRPDGRVEKRTAIEIVERRPAAATLRAGGSPP